MSSSEIRRLTFRHFVSLGANGICAFKIAALPKETILRIAPLVNSEGIKRNILNGRGVVLAIAHMGNWELYAQVAFQRPETIFGTVYQALRNSHLDESHQSGSPQTRRENVRSQEGIRSRNRPIATGTRQCSWIKVPDTEEFGCLFSTVCVRPRLWQPPWQSAPMLRSYPRPSILPALRNGASSFEEEIPYDPGNPEQLTADINSALERQIRRSPADWFWVHNRWKTPWPHLLIARQKRGIYLPPGTDPSKLNPFRFVVRSPNWLGDAVMSRRAARASSTAVRTPGSLSSLRQNSKHSGDRLPEVDEVLSFTPEDSVLTIAKAARPFRSGNSLPEFVSQRGRGMARRHSSQGGISRAPPFDAAHSNHRRAQQKEGGAPKTSGRSILAHRQTLRRR